MSGARLDTGGRILTIRVPMTFTTRGGRKLVIAPDGMPSWAKPRARVDNTMIKALGRAFRWRKLLEARVYVTVEEIAAAEKINTSYVSRILRLTLLAPEIVEAILDGRQPADMTLAGLMRPFPVVWREQARALSGWNRWTATVVAMIRSAIRGVSAVTGDKQRVFVVPQAFICRQIHYRTHGCWGTNPKFYVDAQWQP